MDNNNFRTINIILVYMAKVDFSTVELIKDLLPELINLEGFVPYLN